MIAVENLDKDSNMSFDNHSVQNQLSFASHNSSVASVDPYSIQSQFDFNKLKNDDAVKKAI